VEDKEIFVGLEDSASTWKVCIRSERRIVHEASMPAKYPNLINYLRKGYPGCKITVLYEAGFNGFWLHDELVSDGIKCVVTPPNKVTEEKCNKVKSDTVDARRLAKNLENRDYRSCYVPDAELREDRQISRSIIQVDKVLQATKNRIRSMLYFHGIHRELKSGRWSLSDYKALRKQGLSPSLQFCFDQSTRQLDESLQVKQALRKSLLALATKKRYKRAVDILSGCPGIGKYTAIRLALEWGPISQRFTRGRSLASYLGLVCTEHSSGQRERRGSITKQGPGFVRHWLVECSWVAIRKDPVLLDKYNRVVRNSGKKQRAIIAVARKLAVRMWTLLVHDELYCCQVVM